VCMVQFRTRCQPFHIQDCKSYSERSSALQPLCVRGVSQIPFPRICTNLKESVP